MQIGKMDRRITIQQVTESQSSSGEATQSWATLATVSAQVETDSGDEGAEGAGEQARSNCLFTIRHRSDVTAKHRISYAGNTYDILSVVEIGRRQGLQIRAIAKVP
jgi:SPP1 family predicted phage head-tail adaptor